MSRELLNVNNTDTIKQSDDSTTIILSAHDDNEPKIFKPGDIGTIHITTENYHIPSIPARLIIGSNNVNINSADLVNLPAGKYSLELWVSQKDGPKTTIYPSSGSLALIIDKNADDLTDKTLTTLTLDDLRKDLHDDVDDAVKHIKVDPSMLDLSDYAKKSDIPTVPTISLDTDKRTLTINNQTINIPNSVDLSGYAKSDQVPNVKYNAQTKTLTVDGVTVEIPSTVDLSDYYTKEQVEQQIKENKVTVDLTDYVKREDLADLAKKQDVPTVSLDTEKRTITINGTAINIPDNVDLSSYATKAELPKVSLDVAKREITIGDASLTIPESVDLSNYYTKAQIDDKLASAAAGGKVDLSGYVKTEQLNDYAKKTDIPSSHDLSQYALKSDIKTVDLTPYLKISDADAKYATKADVAAVEKQPGKDGKDGKRGPVIWQTSQPLNTRGGYYSIPISTLTSDVSGTTPAVGDVIIASSDQGSSYALLISSVDNTNANFTSTIKLSGDNGSNGHSVWAYSGSAGNITTPTSSLLNYDGSREPDYGDLVIGSDGSLAEITSVGSNNQYGTSETITTGSVLATIKAQSENTVPTNSTFDYSKYPNMPIISQENLGNYLGLDSTKSYTLNVDDNTLNDGTNTTQKALKPAIYLLRDFQNHGYNLTIKSDQHYGLVYGNAVQLIVTPYMIFAVVVGPNSAETLCARTQWDHDSYGYYGVSNKWFIIGQESKATN